MKVFCGVSQQAISQRFLTFPAELFEKIFKDLLPHFKSKWHSRNKRKIPESVQFTLSKFEKIWIVDCSILEVWFRKLSSKASDPIKYFAAPENQDLGIVKQKRKKGTTKLIVAPFPDKQRGTPEFFFKHLLKPS